MNNIFVQYLDKESFDILDNEFYINNKSNNEDNI